jgi:hypothetical protein
MGALHNGRNQDQRIKALNLCPSIIKLYPDAIRTTLEFISRAEKYDLSVDAFKKDLSLVAGLSVPCGSNIVDMASGLGPTTSLMYWLRNPSLHELQTAFSRKGITPWFRLHLDVRNLSEFNEDGWDRCYRRVAELLANHPSCLGMVGTSWFYDPRLEDISPHLAWLRTTPLERGAFLVKHRPAACDLNAATATSATRRRMVQEGHYVPRGCSIVWPRRALMSWAGV